MAITAPILAYNTGVRSDGTTMTVDFRVNRSFRRLIGKRRLGDHVTIEIKCVDHDYYAIVTIKRGLQINSIERRGLNSMLRRHNVNWLIDRNGSFKRHGEALATFDVPRRRLRRVLRDTPLAPMQ